LVVWFHFQVRLEYVSILIAFSSILAGNFAVVNVQFLHMIDYMVCKNLISYKSTTDYFVHRCHQNHFSFNVAKIKLSAYLSKLKMFKAFIKL